MKQIPLTQGLFTTVDDDMYDYLMQWKWYASKSGNGNWRAVRIANRKWVAMHRVIMNASSGMDVDHINGNDLDNCRSNLRVCTHAENMFNQRVRSDSTTGIKGVYTVINKKTIKYRAQIQFGKKQIHLGTYFNIEDAARAYDIAAKKHHGDFANTNLKD
jgi:hypothetical protein